MADTLNIPGAIYDYVLYCECAIKDWADIKKKSTVKGDGSLMNYIKWDVTSTTVKGDSGGATKFGITHGTWENYVDAHPKKGYSRDLNSMGKNGWLDVVSWYWNDWSCGGYAANYACAIILFQMAWGGYSLGKTLLKQLKESADKKDYSYIKKGGIYRKIADATHAFSDPMKAFMMMRKSLLTHYYNASSSNKPNNMQFRVGWFNRVCLTFSPYGLYLDVGLGGGKALKMTYDSTIEQWETAVTNHYKNGGKGLRKILDWGLDPESVEELISNSGSYDSSMGDSYSSSSSSGSSSSNAYSPCGGVYNLGDYSNSPDMQVEHKQVQSREEVLNTLLAASYSPNDVKKCAELITVDKKKGINVNSK